MYNKSDCLICCIVILECQNIASERLCSIFSCLLHDVVLFIAYGNEMPEIISFI
jgi:hypothetical protein